ncbi:MAG: hypothetical protein ACYSUH_04430, partial [Planctomycetota bacterium]
EKHVVITVFLGGVKLGIFFFIIRYSLYLHLIAFSTTMRLGNKALLENGFSSRNNFIGREKKRWRSRTKESSRPPPFFRCGIKFNTVLITLLRSQVCHPPSLALLLSARQDHSLDIAGGGVIITCGKILWEHRALEFSPQATSEIEEIADRIDCPFEFRCYKSRNNQSSQDADACVRCQSVNKILVRRKTMSNLMKISFLVSVMAFASMLTLSGCQSASKCCGSPGAAGCCATAKAHSHEEKKCCGKPGAAGCCTPAKKCCGKPGAAGCCAK